MPTQNRKQEKRLTLLELCDRLESWALDYYQRPDPYSPTGRKPTGEHHNIRDALVPLRHLPRAATRDPRRLTVDHFEACQAWLVQRGKDTVNTINSKMRRLRTAMRRARKMRLIPPAVVEAATLVEPLRQGRSSAKPQPERRVTTWDEITSAMAESSFALATMVEVHARTGMRASELVSMRSKELRETADGLMLYLPGWHKTKLHSYERRIFIGPEAQSALRPWLKRCEAQGKTEDDLVWPLTRSNSYYTALRKVCKNAGITPAVTPLLIRRWFGTMLRAEAGLDATQVQMGHAHASTTEIYGKPLDASATAAMVRFG